MSIFPSLSLVESVYDANQDCGVLFGGFVNGVLSNSVFLVSDQGTHLNEIQVKGIVHICLFIKDLLHVLGLSMLAACSTTISMFVEVSIPQNHS